MGKRPTMFEASFVVMISLALAMVVGPQIQGLGPYASLALTEVLLRLAPVLIVVAVERYDTRAVLGLAPVSPVDLALSLAAGGLAWFLASAMANGMAYVYGLVGRLPPTASLPLATPVDFALGLAVAGVLTAVSEETMFRGFVLSAYRGLGSTRAVVVAALAFGLFHQSLLTFVPAVAAGLVAGYVMVRTGSLYAAIAAHAGHNALALLVGYFYLGGNEGLPTLPVLRAMGLAALAALPPLGLVMWALFRRTSPHLTGPGGSWRQAVAAALEPWPAKVFAGVSLLAWVLEVMYVLGRIDL